MLDDSYILAFAIADFLEQHNVKVNLKVSDFRGSAGRNLQDQLMTSIDHEFPALLEEIRLVLYRNYSDPNTSLRLIAAFLEEEGLYTPDEHSVQPLYPD